MAVVLPVRDGGDDLDGWLRSVVPQVQTLGGELLVVDDGSTDGSAERAAAAGATVLASVPPGGPYAARNVGWRAATAPVVVFTDVRNRADPGWLEHLVRAVEAPGVAIAGGDVDVAGDGRLAHRLARRHSHVDPSGMLADPFLPYVTTSSMAVRRPVLEAVGGFVERRSGADAELCWAAQLAGLGSVVAAPGSRMACEPRGSVGEVCAQWRRYARSYVELRHRFAPQGARMERRLGIRPFVAIGRQGVRRLVRGPVRDPLLELADAWRWLGYEVALRRAVARTRRSG